VSDEFDDAAAAPEVDKPDNDADASGAPEQADEQSSGEDSFTEFDPSSIPESGASPQWLKEQYDHMRGDYTRKMQEFGETRRDRDQLNQIVEGIRNGDAETRRSLLQLLNVDQQAALEAFDLQMAEQEAEEQAEPSFDQDLDFRDPRVDQWEAEKAAQRQQEAATAQAQEAEAVADEVGGRMEEELKASLGEEPDDEVAKFIFDHAIDNPDQLGQPDVKAGVAAWNRLLDQQREKWIGSRQGQRAPTQGIPGSERFDTSTKEGRDALALMGVQEANSSR